MVKELGQKQQNVKPYAISVKPQDYQHFAAQLDTNCVLQSWHDPKCTQQVVNLIQNPLYISKNTYSDTVNNAELDNYTLTGSDKRLNAAKQLNKGIIDELLENANNMRELVGLNDYIDKIEIKPQRNLIPACDLGLSQIFNWVSMENYFLKAELIPASDLEIQMPTMDITENSGIKLFLE